MKTGVQKVVSGGQTGVDRAALDAAIELGLATGGWVPKGRLAEDGTIPDFYDTLRETDTSSYSQRTELNVRDSDCTLVLSRGALHGGSLLTLKCAERYRRPVLHVDLGANSMQEARTLLEDWLAVIDCTTLNVAGPRASSDPKIYGLSRVILAEVLGG